MTEPSIQQDTPSTAASPVLSAFGTFVAIFTAPSRAMQSVLQRPRAWFPIVLTIVCNAVLFLWYYQIVDFPWLQDRLTAAVADPAARAQAQHFITKNLLLASSAGGLLIGVPFAYAVFALYFFVVAKIRNLPIGYGKWFGFAAWVSIPAILTLPLGAIQILMAQGGHLDLNQLNPVTLNSLFFHLESGRHWASLLDSLSLITLWTIVVATLGFQVWSKASRSVSAAVALAPYIVIYGVWAAIAFMSKGA